MYIYYLLAALGQRVWWKKYLTSAQIVQFITGFVYTNIYLWNDFTRAGAQTGGCGSPQRRYAAFAAHFVNISFIVLFAQFYKQSYNGKKSKSNGKAS